jgi:hypothetical protein
MSKDASHYHITKELRIELSKTIKQEIEELWGGAGKSPIVFLCKETHDIRKAVGVEHGECDCGGVMGDEQGHVG